MQWINSSDLYSKKGLTKEQLEIRDIAVNSLEGFIRLVAPYQLIAHCHSDLYKWIEHHYEEHKLILWPRDHGKSRNAAFYTAWEIVRDPTTTIIYASATAEKAEEQLRFIKDILDSPIVRRYFPELLLEDEGRRKAWNKTYIIIDHPARALDPSQDATVMTAGLEKTITGKHCKRLVLDDIVVKENNTDQGRKEVNKWLAQAASICSADSIIFDVGTRYHPQDAHQMAMDMVYDEPTEDEFGNEVLEPRELFVVNIANVEQDGQFLWPRHQRKDGKWFGFNQLILNKKRAVYEAAGEITQFFAQYYNDPNDKSTSPISRELFKYYDRDKMSYTFGGWDVEGHVVQMYAAVDLAATVADTSDYTALVVGGIEVEDGHSNRYLAYANRMRTSKISDIFNELLVLFEKYQYRKLRIEAVGGFRLVAQDLADRLYDAGVRIPIDIYVPPNNEGKQARVNGILEPLYRAGAIYHFRGGHAQILEDELVSVNPVNDDLKDAWAMCVDLMQRPVHRIRKKRKNVIQYHPRFGGVKVA